jgi:tetrapyrrole methylase family protein/MazG family protein
MSLESKEFHALVAIVDRLLGPDGCPWDREQTVFSLCHMLLEEACEVIDCIHDQDREKLADELGDVIIVSLFLAKVSQKEERFSWTLPLEKAAEKLVRRHPHIFGGKEKLLSSKAVMEQWEREKAKEAGHADRKSRFDGIPKSLPSLAMMQKLLGKLHKKPSLHSAAQTFLQTTRQDPEEEFARQLTCLIVEGEKNGIQAEAALRRFFGVCKDELQKEEKLSSQIPCVE